MTRTPHVLVAGGGIGGLAAALACARAGAQPKVLERASAFTEVGAGIQLGPNVTKLLHAWDLQAALARVAAFPARLHVRSARTGQTLGVLRLGELALARYGAPYVTVHRADVHAVLLEAARARGVAVCLNTEVQGVCQDAAGVQLKLEGGTQMHAQLLVGADGLWSRVRHAVLGDGSPRATGHLAYRALVRQDDLPAALRAQDITVWLGPQLHLVQYPVRAGQDLNVVAIVHGQLDGDLQSWDHSANAAELRAAMAQTCAALQDLIAALPHWRLWPLCIRPPMAGAHEFGRARVALLGDAAHPMLPYLAQGAGMAIEDAAVLGQSLTTPGRDLAAALRTYAAQRWARNARVQARAMRNGRVFHATGPLRWARDVAIKLGGERLLDMPWLYRGA